MYQFIHCVMVLKCCVVLTSAWYDVWKIPLTGKDWQIINANKSINIKGSVPGSVHTSLMNAGILADPYYRFNDALYKWVAYDNWTYTKHFTLGTDEGPGLVDLVFEGLDTIAQVWLNGHLLGSTDNMFRRYVFPVKHLLKGANNTLQVVFFSPVLSAAEAARRYPYDVPPDCPPTGQNGECHVNQIRKEQASFSWDWGPSFPTVGIWKKVFIQGYNSAIINQISTQAMPAGGGDWWVNGTVYFDVGRNDSNASRTVHGELVVEVGGFQVHPMVTLTTEKSYADFSVKVDQDYAQLWWPNGYGSQHLYELDVNFTSAEFGSEHSLDSVMIGLRTVELVQEPVPGSPGLSFYFKINGRPIYMKGSNWIPADSFQERITKDSLRRQLTSAKLAHMNMLRVWGGGVYESETFYSLADELGLLVWQDMMFACALYPGDANFLENVQQEVTHQVRRLKNHPSVAIWAGNNENEGMIPAKVAKIPRSQRPAPPSVYYNDYVRLYITTIRGVVRSEDTTRPFVSSSPSNGVETEREGFVARNPQDTHYGDVHFYNYAVDTWNYSSFPKPRFASEFGYQSWCSLDTLKSVSEPSDWSINSSFTENRQHHPEGNPQLITELSMHLNMSNASDPQTQFEDFIYLTQINQAVGIKTEVEHYRRLQNTVLDGQGHTMGALYWQLNDIWQAPTWASIEFGGRWKMLHYYTRDFFSPLLLSPLVNGSTVQLVLINESAPVTQEHFHTEDKVKRKENDRSDDSLKFIPSAEMLPANEKLPMSDGVFRQKFEESQNLQDKNLRFHGGSPPVPGSHGNHVPEDSGCLVRGGGLELEVAMFSWSSLTPLHTWKTLITKESPGPTQVVFQSSVSELLSESSCPSRHHCVLVFSLPQCDLQNWLLLSNFTTVQGLHKANLKVTAVSASSPSTLDIHLTTDQVAAFVWLEAPGFDGYFSDNGFLMFSAAKMVTFTSWRQLNDTEIAMFKEKLTSKSLMDIY